MSADSDAKAKVTSDGLDLLVTEVKTLVANMEGSSQDLVALTVEVESFRHDLAEAQTTFDSESRRRGLITAFAITTAGAILVTDVQIEKCRIDPLIHRFTKQDAPSPGQEYFCDVTFPTHNHGSVNLTSTTLTSANYLGIVIYSLAALALLSWWVKSKLLAKKMQKSKELRAEQSRRIARKIYNGPSHNVTKGMVETLNDEETS